MIFLSFLPLVYAYSCWIRRNNSLAIIDLNIDLLVRLKLLCRSSVVVPRTYGAGDVSKAISELVDMGLSCTNSLSESALWLRLLKVQCLKAHKLTCMWTLRLTFVIGASLLVRCFLVNDLSLAIFGMNPSDRYLMGISGMAGLAGTAVFLQFVPSPNIDQRREVSGLASWVKDRALSESGLQITSDCSKIRAMEKSEMSIGLALTSEKIEALGQVWRHSIDDTEKRTEAASELMPFLELVFFGLCVVCILLEPSLILGS